jgi:hypothetical protein
MHVDTLVKGKPQVQESIPTGHSYAWAAHRHLLVATEDKYNRRYYI